MSEISARTIVCLFCKRSNLPSDEHVFAEPLGRVGVIRDVCRDCNSILGQQVDIAADRDAILSTARRQAGLAIRPQSIREVNPLVEPAGDGLRTQFDRRQGKPVVSPQRVGDEIVASRADLPRTVKHAVRDYAERLGQIVTEAQLDQFVADVMQEWDAAPIGTIVRRSLGDVHLRLPKYEVDTNATVHYRDEPELLDRLCAKVAIEVLAIAFGSDFARRTEFDSLREYALPGATPPVQIETVRLPSLEHSDSVRQHTVLIGNFSGPARVRIEFFGS